jgi:hypothetical protein
MKIVALAIVALFSTTLNYAQNIELPETIISLNYKYVDLTDTNIIPDHIKNLEAEVLNYDHKKQLSELYDDEYDTYSVSFYVPKGRIVAAYNKDGKIIRTIEKYSNVRLPLVVMQSVSTRFPNWGIVEDVYVIKYQSDQDSLKHEYKIKIKNEEQVLTVKTDENGIFI